MRKYFHKTLITTSIASLCLAAGLARASSHMDAPLITLDDAANTTDVYAFRSESDGQQYLTTALAVYPFEEPGIGPNKYNFDDNVRYTIHVAVGKDVAKGRASFSYQFEFKTRYKNEQTILQSYLNVINDVDDDAQNLTQTYTVTKATALGNRGRGRNRGVSLNQYGEEALVPPNNQGIATPKYNRDDIGENLARDGVSDASQLDTYTSQSVVPLQYGYRAFAGQRDDGFYGDIQAIFDLLQLRNPGVDAQAGFNVHTIVLDIPLYELGGDQQIVGVFATTERRRVTVRSNNARYRNREAGRWVQVGRQGNPLFAEGFVAIEDKDLYSRTSPEQDADLFRKYADTPELAALLNALVVPDSGLNEAPTNDRSDLVGIFIPDLIKVDLSTGPARLAGSGESDPYNPDDEGFSRLGIFGGDVLTSTVQDGFGDGTVPGGWPNGRRFGDDVVDIGVSAVLSDLRTSPPEIQIASDNANQNDIGYNKIFPYAATPLNGRNHRHHGQD